MPAKRLLTLLTVLSVVVVSSYSLADDFDLSWYTIDGGGVMNSTDGQPNGFVLSGTIGQLDAGMVMTDGVFDLTGGFWFSIPSGDCNSTGSINLLDQAEFASCLSGSGVALPSPDCACIDFDGDNDADLLDFAELQNAFTGA